MSVSPDGSTAAYAVDNQVDAIDLTLVPLDGGPHDHGAGHEHHGRR